MFVNILIGLGCMLFGACSCYLIFRFVAGGMLKKAEEEAELIKKNKLIEAKEKFIALKLEHDNRVRADEQKKQQREQQLNQRQNQLNQQQSELQRQQNELQGARQQIENQQKALDYKQHEVDKMQEKMQQQIGRASCRERV